MHIFIDESGPFAGIGQFPSVSVVGALIVPDGRLPNLEKQYKKPRANLPKDKKGEVKGRLLNEQQVENAISLLFADSALFEAAVIDMGLHSEAGLKAFQAAQAEKMTANLTDAHQAALKEQVWAARKTLEGFEPPLMAQAIMTFELVFDLLEFATMYYAAGRRPGELAAFNWVIDAKGDRDDPNEWEEWWSSFIFPVLQTRSFSRPFRQLPEGVADYSHLARFETEADPFIRARAHWKDGDPPLLDFGSVMKESFTFAVEATPGLELVDIITNATRRAFLGNLKKLGWQRIPQLMAHRGKRPYFSMLSLQDGPEPNRVYPYADVLETFRRDGRLLLPKGLRENVQRQ